MASESITSTSLNTQPVAVPKQDLQPPTNPVSKVLDSKPIEKVEAKQEPIKIDTQPVGSAEEISKAIEQVQVMMDLRNRSVSISQDSESTKEKSAHRLILIKFSDYTEAISKLKAANAALGDAAWVIGRPTTR